MRLRKVEEERDTIVEEGLNWEQNENVNEKVEQELDTILEEGQN